MNDISTHPSRFALDLVALGQPSVEVASHIAACEQCQAHVTEAMPATGAVPSWAHQSRRFTWAWPLFATLCAAGLAMVVNFEMTDKTTEITRAKGHPSIAVYIEHQGQVRLWDGRSTVSAGDRLQLKVAAAGFNHLAVGVADEGSDWKTAFKGPVSSTGETILPRSFQVDPDTTTLHLGLLLCDSACADEGIADATQSTPRDTHRWWTSFVLTRKDER